MNQKKIGMYIQNLRKSIGMTQKQLAEKMDVNEEVILEWEKGISMPDISQFSEICHDLNTNMNEILSGERLSDEKYFSKAEENMKNLMKEILINSKGKREVDWRRLGIGIILMVLSLAMMYSATFGGSWSELYSYFDFWSICFLLLFVITCIIFSGARKFDEIVNIGRKIIFPISLFISLVGIGEAFATNTELITLLPSLQFAILPIIYASILYIPLVIVEEWRTNLSP